MVAGLNQTVPGFNPALGDMAGINKFSPFWNYWNNQQNNLNLQNQLQGTGFDPLHFFIDLRVSGHIYDKKIYAEGVNANEPLNLQKQELDSYQNENNNKSDDKSAKIEIEDDKKVIKQENEHGESREKQEAEKENNSVTNEDVKRNSAFDVPNHNNNNIENQNIIDRRTLKGNLKNKAKTNYGINYILNNLPKIYKSFNQDSVDDIDRGNTDDDETGNNTKDLKYLKSYHNNLRCNKDVYTFQNNYEHFSKLHEGDQNIEISKLETETNTETPNECYDKADYAAQVHLNITKDSSDDEELYRDIRNDFVDVENSESEIEDINNNSDDDFLLRQEI